MPREDKLGVPSTCKEYFLSQPPEPVRVRIPGLDAPRDARSTCDLLRPRYSRATLLVLAVERDGALENVRTVVIYGTKRLQPGPDVSRTIAASAQRPSFVLMRETLDAEAADAFVAQALTGWAFVSNRDVAFRCQSWWEGLIPRGARNEGPSPSSATSIWQRRRQPTQPQLLGVPLTAASYREIQARLPENLGADWAVLDVRSDLTTLETLDEWYLVPVRLDKRHRGDHIEVTVTDPEGWLCGRSASVRLDGYRQNLRQSTKTCSITEAGVYVLSVTEPQAETALEIDGVVLDVDEGTFIGAPPIVEPISGGVPPDFTELRAALGRPGVADHYLDIVVDPRKMSADPAADGRALIERIVKTYGAATPTTLDLVDPWNFDAAMLRTIARALPRGSRIRIVSNTAQSDADFATVAGQTGVTIERYAATGIPQHDRFMRLGGRLWSLGISLNQLGAAFCLILEVRSPSTMRDLDSIINTCLANPLAAHS